MVATHQIFSQDGYRLLQECIHCGLCLPTCPTYVVNGKEADSPRGRLSLMKYVDREPDIDAQGAFRHIDLCLGCLACQTACPSGVRYGHLLESSRTYQRQEIKPLTGFQRQIVTGVTSHRPLGMISSIIAVVQRLGLDRLVRVLRLLPATLRFQLAGMPRITGRAFSRTHDRLLPAMTPSDSSQGKVALFTGCVMDYWFSEVHAASVRVLQWNGFDVTIPEGQSCCGALHAHAGLEEEAEACLDRNWMAFQDIDAQALVVNAAGCGAQLRTEAWTSRNGLPVVDISEWLADKLIRPPGKKLYAKVTYDAPCHLHHAQSIHKAPYQLLETACEHLAVLPEAEMCCGSAGFYSLIQAEMSQQVLERKIAHIQSIAPATLITGNPGCQMQLQAGLHASGMKIPVLHIIQVLDQAYRQDEAYLLAFNLSE
ncbi:MAG: 4Fe-4S dicluster domain-containing protein [Fidelibacterota bacterium]|nr:MAG: 4Fe-4S dicluster domain-containing protein [Candidatus Neomarinimicrobiota bacterium]